ARRCRLRRRGDRRRRRGEADPVPPPRCADAARRHPLLEYLFDLDHAAGSGDRAPDKVLGMHFMNPVPLMSLVELIRGQATSTESMAVASELCAMLGKTALEAADYPGFIAN